MPAPKMTVFKKSASKRVARGCLWWLKREILGGKNRLSNPGLQEEREAVNKQQFQRFKADHHYLLVETGSLPRTNEF